MPSCEFNTVHILKDKHFIGDKVFQANLEVVFAMIASRPDADKIAELARILTKWSAWKQDDAVGGFTVGKHKNEKLYVLKNLRCGLVLSLREPIWWEEEEDDAPSASRAHQDDMSQVVELADELGLGQWVEMTELSHDHDAVEPSWCERALVWLNKTAYAILRIIGVRG